MQVTNSRTSLNTLTMKYLLHCLPTVNYISWFPWLHYLSWLPRLKLGPIMRPFAKQVSVQIPDENGLVTMITTLNPLWSRALLYKFCIRLRSLNVPILKCLKLWDENYTVEVTFSGMPLLNFITICQFVLRYWSGTQTEIVGWWSHKSSFPF
jgi:hypothetical protein